ncbi:thiamine pyrophosphate-binding protein [Bailinhaonella thermotolerans]|uniref:Thiamine pyrophosphate-binding protein n=1 Tax=Bailinhaonella thermotolerans TaxID=1070861 RepID=A0A3A4A773_9ACTN|nr:thiamine pyrophosphate-binding protein [Bailinhaonella thermotolerans]RJL24425.1 thiamine pyrophosphate-binding protein [Bailinhaonella thermotolerans]
MPDIHGNGGDVLVQVLRAHRVGVVFGVVSVHNLPLVEAVDRDLRFVPVRHEAAAVNAADAYARVSGGLGCALTSTGTGAANAAGALVEALAASSRVLHVTGQIDSRYLGQGRGVIHETKDQPGMLAAISKHARTVTAPATAAGVLLDAVRHALAVPCGPVSVEWPVDLQYEPHPPAEIPPPGAGRDRVTYDAPGGTYDEAAVGRAAELVAGARRPVLWIGGGCRGAREEARALAELLGAPVLTSNSGRGVIPEDHELVVGNFASGAAGAGLLAGSDLLVSVGTRFRSNETRHYTLKVPEAHVQIDVDPAAIGRVYPVTAGVLGDAAAVLAALTRAITEPRRTPAEGGPGTDGPGTGGPGSGGPGPGGRAGRDGWRERGREARRAARERLRAEIGVYAEVCDAVRACFDRRSPLVRDVTIPSSQWGNRLLPVYEPETNVFPLGGGIGQGLAMGLGAALARPGVPTLIMAGDGGLAVHLGELATLAQERPWAVVLVFNDRGYGVLRNTQDAYRGRRAGVDLFTPDLAALAAAMAMPYGRVVRPGEIGEALAKAVAAREPYLLEIDVDRLGPPPVPFVPPVPVPGTR